MIERAELEKTTRPREVIGYDDDLELYLKQIDAIFNISDIIEEPQEEPQVVNYYLMNKLTYKFFWNWDGFLHCGISYDGVFKKDDVKEAARIVERYIHEMDAKSVLELGCGLGANSAFLARRNPGVRFEAIDLSNKPLRGFSKISNLRFHRGDYHDLSRFEDAAYDIAFIVEALCYSKNKLRVLREVKKKLKKNGLFICFDPYEPNRTRPLSESEDIILKLPPKTVALDKLERLDHVEDYMKQEFSIVVSKDMSAYVLPFMESVEAKVHFYFKHPIYAKTLNKIVPPVVIKNLIGALLGPTTLRRQLFCYYHHVLRNDR